MADTFNLATEIGKLRLVIQDVDITDPRWHDTELQVFLDLAAEEEAPDTTSARYVAASLAMIAQASDQAAAANTIKLGMFSDNEKPIYDAYIQQAKVFRQHAAVGSYCNPPDVVFTMDRDNGETPGTMHLW